MIMSNYTLNFIISVCDFRHDFEKINIDKKTKITYLAVKL
ncbi:hypothetical protein XBKB1_3980002 [Xenorhabdus bovienii str. kraussei Becker Underwood]|uniref:Uncharacterized protein n=1 Tax=Xenorhabdus bovienii str. kraussei Becker Underwood TaxID=1398204 RepID=A0A077PLX7_XENBV|nr:hypothetical protein XBKB1_3980002 [Xenorhabdus bovienii str. kraussei Becker Underwood]